MNNQLILLMQRVLADSYMMYLKAQGYHWNVEGILFPMLHDFFGKVYDEVYSSIDSTAEEIRAIGGYPITTLLEIDKYRSIPDTSMKEPTEMLKDLSETNAIVIRTLSDAFYMAQSSKEEGLADYLAGRIDSHKKHGWMINATLKNVG